MKANTERKRLLKKPVEHINIKSFDGVQLIDSMRKMSFSARDTAAAAEMFVSMIDDKSCVTVLSLAGSTGSGGCLQLYRELIDLNMIDVVVATGASIVDMDFFEALGFRHYQGTPDIDDAMLRKNYIDRIYDTYIDEHELQYCDRAITSIADSLAPGVYSSRGFINEMGKFLKKQKKRNRSLVEAAYDNDVPIFCPAFSDSSAGFGLVIHQSKNIKNHVSIDSVRDFRELTQLKIDAKNTGMLIIGGGAPKNFIQDTVICAELLGHDVPMHKYAIQITVADARDGACSSSTLKEANSWGKVDGNSSQMVFAEATTVLPLIANYAFKKAKWKSRKLRRLNKIFT